jgi:hypothetical protein
LGELTKQIKPYAVKPPVPSIVGLTWPTADERGEFLETEEGDRLRDSHPCQKPSRELIYE